MAKTDHTNRLRRLEARDQGLNALQLFADGVNWATVTRAHDQTLRLQVTPQASGEPVRIGAACFEQTMDVVRRAFGGSDAD